MTDTVESVVAVSSIDDVYSHLYTYALTLFFAGVDSTPPPPGGFSILAAERFDVEI